MMEVLRKINQMGGVMVSPGSVRYLVAAMTERGALYMIDAARLGEMMEGSPPPILVLRIERLVRNDPERAVIVDPDGEEWVIFALSPSAPMMETTARALGIPRDEMHRRALRILEERMA